MRITIGQLRRLIAETAEEVVGSSQGVIDALRELSNYIENEEYYNEDSGPYVRKVYGSRSRRRYDPAKRYLPTHIVDQMIYDKMLSVDGMLQDNGMHSLFDESSHWRKARELMEASDGPLAWHGGLYSAIAYAASERARQLENPRLSDTILSKYGSN
jgi:hypothetical protein